MTGHSDNNVWQIESGADRSRRTRMQTFYNVTQRTVPLVTSYPYELKEGAIIYIHRVYKVMQWANTTNIGGLIIQGLFMNSQKYNNSGEKQCNNSATPLKG